MPNSARFETGDENRTRELVMQLPYAPPDGDMGELFDQNLTALEDPLTTKIVAEPCQGVNHSEKFRKIKKILRFCECFIDFCVGIVRRGFP